MSDTGVVVFDPEAFKAQFTAFATTPDAMLQMDFALATFYLNNSPRSVVHDLGMRAALLNLITAHIAFLLGRIAAGDGSDAALVGQVQSAGEGSVNVSLVASQSQSGEFWKQSQYGNIFWQMALPFRSFRYFPAPVFPCAPSRL